jgi:hypothetical protein
MYIHPFTQFATVGQSDMTSPKEGKSPKDSALSPRDHLTRSSSSSSMMPSLLKHSRSSSFNNLEASSSSSSSSNSSSHHHQQQKLVLAPSFRQLNDLEMESLIAMEDDGQVDYSEVKGIGQVHTWNIPSWNCFYVCRVRIVSVLIMLFSFSSPQAFNDIQINYKLKIYK